VHERVLLGLILLVGVGLRFALLRGPYAEIDADEAIVGLMALNIPRELPIFFWEQHYLGSLEAVVAAALFALVGPSNAALKAVPALFSVAFIGLVYASARRAFGPAPALLSALYLAIPPSFFAVWSVKARGGYAELLALGQLFLFLCQIIGETTRPAARLAALAGLVGGLALWTHPLAVVYLAAGTLYVALRRRAGAPRAAPSELSLRLTTGTTHAPPRRGRLILTALVGFAVGVLPIVIYNLAEGFPSLRYATEGGTAPRSALVNLWGLARYGAPVLAGLAEGTASKALLDVDWPGRPGSNPVLTFFLLGLVALVLWSYRGSLLALTYRSNVERAKRIEHGAPTSNLRPWPVCSGERYPSCHVRAAPFLLVILCVPLVVAVSRFADLWAEPRYALPAYSAIPLFAAAAWRLRIASPPGWVGHRLAAALRRSRQPVFLAVVCGVLAVNAVSLATSDFRLALPTSAGGSTEANRDELIEYLLAHGLTRIYTDYWIGYPLAFESRERIVPAIRSGGFDRRAAYGHQVWTADDPAFVFPRDALGDREFRQDLATAGGTADIAEVSAYRVYTRVRPLGPLRP
jgi:hypothetical protein